MNLRPQFLIKEIPTRLTFSISVLLVFLTACSSAETPEPTPDIDAIVSATVAAQQAAFYQVELVSPEDGATFTNPSEVVLEWEWARNLDEGEAFDVRVWREGEPNHGIAWADEATYDPSNWLSQQEAGEFLWTIAAIQGEDDTVEAVIGEAPTPRQFTLESNVVMPTPTPEPERIDRVVRLEAEGFEVEIVAHLPDFKIAITAIVMTPEGDILALAQAGQLLRLRDADGDGFYEEQEQLLFNDELADLNLKWATGMALYEDRIYIADSGRVGYYHDENGDEHYADDEYTAIVTDLPARDYPLHSTNGIAFDPDGKLYLTIGSTTDHGPIQVEYESSIVRMNPDGSDFEVFATGFRNSFDMSFSPDGRLFAGDNSPDRLMNDMPFYPPEELNYVREGRDYGFPDVYGKGIAIRPYDREVEDAIVAIPTSSVVTSVAYYAADQFPEYYQDGVFVSLFGGFNNEGKQVIFVPLEETEDGNYTGEYEPFLTFINGRKPLDLLVAPDGSLLVTEWNQGYIIRVTYVGDEE